MLLFRAALYKHTTHKGQSNKSLRVLNLDVGIGMAYSGMCEPRCATLLPIFTGLYIHGHIRELHGREPELGRDLDLVLI